jgi:hypothetical protein
VKHRTFWCSSCKDSTIHEVHDQLSRCLRCHKWFGEFGEPIPEEMKKDVQTSIEEMHTRDAGWTGRDIAQELFG